MSKPKAIAKPEWLHAHAILRQYGLQSATLMGLVVKRRLRMRSRPVPKSEQRPRLTYYVPDVERYLKQRGKIMT